MEKRLVLEDKDGTVLRAYVWDGTPAQVIRRGDTRRLEVVHNTNNLQKEKVPFEKLGELTSDSLAKRPFLVGQLGHLKLLESIDETVKDERISEEDDRLWLLIFVALLLLSAGTLSYLMNRTQVSPKLEEELKQQVVKIVKKIPPRQETQKIVTHQQETQTKVAKRPDAIKRMGALAVLGSLSKSNQRGGINLNAVNTSAGPGLGGTAGSGGVQTSLYAKGIVGAPVGPGANIQGAGGYGTKGKGGGQAGYGKLSLIGSSGASPVPLGQEAVVASGLDRDQIFEVINRNMGQIRFCYEQGLQGDASLHGRVAVDFVIGGNGLIKSASIGSSSLNSKIVEDCILMRLKTWKFPLPDGGVDVKVAFPFNLRRAGQG